MPTIKQIEDQGLYIISWDLADDDGGIIVEYQGDGLRARNIHHDTVYAVSIDNMPPGEPTLEQKEYCEWWMSAELAAAAYFGEPSASRCEDV